MNYQKSCQALGEDIASTLSSMLASAQAQNPKHAYFVMDIENSKFRIYNGVDDNGSSFQHIDVYCGGVEEAQELLRREGIYSDVFHNSMGSPSHILLSRSKMAPLVSSLKSFTLWIVSFMVSLVIAGLFSVPMTAVVGLYTVWMIFTLNFCKHKDFRKELDIYAGTSRRITTDSLSFLR